jgi:hypothetical protein
VFQIWVPYGATEIQIRASINNFQNGFRLDVDSGVSGGSIYDFKCTGTKNGRNYYEGVTEDFIVYWTGSAWSFGYTSITSSDDVEFPWQCTTFSGDATVTVTELDDDSKFVYRWCSTGEDEDALWGTLKVDGDAWLYFSNQKGGPDSETPQPYTNMQLQKWNGNSTDPPSNTTSLTSQLQLPNFDPPPTAPFWNYTPVPALLGTPGHFVIFQPSRSAHLFQNGDGDWMNINNKYLRWVVQYESAGDWELHPDLSQLWNVITPSEWKKERMELLPEK